MTHDDYPPDMSRSYEGRSPKKTKDIDKMLKSIGAPPLILPTERENDDVTPDVDEEQVALSAWGSEDAAMGISIINIFIGIFALVAAVSGGYSGSVVVLVGIMALILVALRYFTAHSRRTAGATAAVIEFRAMRQSAQLPVTRSAIQPTPHHSFIELRVNRRPR